MMGMNEYQTHISDHDDDVVKHAINDKFVD